MVGLLSQVQRKRLQLQQSLVVAVLKEKGKCIVFPGTPYKVASEFSTLFGCFRRAIGFVSGLTQVSESSGMVEPESSKTRMTSLCSSLAPQ